MISAKGARGVLVRNGWRLPLGKLGVAIVLCLGLQSGVAMGQPLVTGVSWLNSDDPVAFQHVRESGARFVHLPIPWHVVAPKNEPNSWQPENPADPHYDWTHIDPAVVRAVQAGLTPVLLLEGAPSWGRACQPSETPATGQCFPNPTAFAAFSVALARRYSGSIAGLPRVRYWQALNEPNLSLVYAPQFKGGKPVSPGVYRKLINAFYFAIKSVDPSNLVLSAGLGPIAIPRHTVGPMRFTRLLLCMTGRKEPHPTPGDCEGGVHFDIFDIHPYTTGGPEHQGHVDDVQLGDLAKLQELLKAADEAGRIKGRFRRTPLWITEFSWDSSPPDPGGLSMPLATRWVAEALYRAWSAGVTNFFWFSLRDFPADESILGISLQSGLYFRGPSLAEDRPKKIFYAFRFPFVAFSDAEGFGFWGRTPTSTGGAVTIQIWDRGLWRTAAVVRANGSGIFQGHVETSYGRADGRLVRARFRTDTAIPFSLRDVRDFHQPPFGS